MIQGWLLRQLPWLLLAVLLLGAGGFAGLKIMERGRAELLPKVQQLEADLAHARAALEAEKANRRRAEEAAHGYAQELEKLRSRPISRTPVRLCRAPAPAVPSSGSTSAGAAGAAAGSGGDVGAAGGDPPQGPDIGPELRALALSCDKENAKLRALQRWATGSGEPK